MKRLLLPLLAALALPTAVNAEVAGYYLVGIADRKPFVVPMKTIELCEEAGKKFGDNKKWSPKFANAFQITYVCLKAK